MRSWVIGSRARNATSSSTRHLASGPPCSIDAWTRRLSSSKTWVDQRVPTSTASGSPRQTRDHTRPGNHDRPDHANALAVRTGEVRPHRPRRRQRYRARRPQGLEPARSAHDRRRFRSADRRPRLIQRNFSEFGRDPRHRLTPLSKSDTVYFGSLAVPAATLWPACSCRRLNRRRSVSRQSLAAAPQRVAAAAPSRPPMAAAGCCSRRLGQSHRKIAGCWLRLSRRLCWRS